MARSLTNLLEGLGVNRRSNLQRAVLMTVAELLYQELPISFKRRIDVFSLTYYLYGEQQQFGVAISPDDLRWCEYQWRDCGRLQ